MSEQIPYERLGIPAPLQARLAPDAPPGPKLPIARGLLPVSPDVMLGICYLLSMDPDPGVADAARDTLCGLPLKQLNIALSEKTHPKILEFLAEFRTEEPELDLRLLRLRATNLRAARIIAARASESLCDEITRNHERLLLTPQMVIELHANEACTDAQLERALSFLELEGLPQRVSAVRPFRAGVESASIAAAPPAASALVVDPEEEVDAAVRGELSPALQRRAGRLGGAAFGDREAVTRGVGQFQWNFQDEADFDALLLGDDDVLTSVEDRKTIVQVIAGMSVAQKLKLAYLGNKETRAILIRDRVKSVPVAVIRSGRVSDGEVVAFASDRNLPRDVIREIAMSKEYVRKYNVKVALANNPKTPLNAALGFLKDFYKKDLQNLARNKGVPSVLSGAAFKLFRQKSN